MLSGAYNYALEKSRSGNRKWLLLLDQDTILTERYFSELNNFLVSGNDAVAAVPILQQGDIHLSPISYSPRLGPYYFFRNLKQLNPNTKGCISGFNSAALLNVSFMISIGGFSKFFPLDMLDHWYFYKIHIAGKKVFILNATLEQNLSLLDMDKSMSIVRYSSYLKSLKQFTKDLKFPAVLILYFKLFEFIVSQIIRQNKRKYLKTTLKAFFFLN
jgi:GT2 family glycosyltransferase